GAIHPDLFARVVLDGQLVLAVGNLGALVVGACTQHDGLAIGRGVNGLLQRGVGVRLGARLRARGRRGNVDGVGRDGVG
ncbi:hypothetical protein CN601_22250, partial [Bacillus sp. AFS017336]